MRAILTYHSVDESGSVISTGERIFRRHVEWLARSPVQVTTVDVLMALPPGTEAVAITFDDGYDNFATHAWPVLRDHALPVTVFVVSHLVGHGNAWRKNHDRAEPTLPLAVIFSLTGVFRDEVKKTAKLGVALSVLNVFVFLAFPILMNVIC